MNFQPLDGWRTKGERIDRQKKRGGEREREVWNEKKKERKRKKTGKEKAEKARWMAEVSAVNDASP